MQLHLLLKYTHSKLHLCHESQLIIHLRLFIVSTNKPLIMIVGIGYALNIRRTPSNQFRI